MTVCVMLLYIVYDGIFLFNMYSKKRCNVLSQDQQFVKEKKKQQNYIFLISVHI